MDTKKLRQKILDLAIRGKLVPQNPNDEPASVLIEKIRVEKEKLIKEKKIKRDKNESYIYRSDKSYYEKFADGTVKCIDDEIPFEIPESWEWERIGNIAFVTKLAGFEYTKYFTKDNISTENTIPLVRAQNVKMGAYYENTQEAINMNLSVLLDRCALTKKCLLMTFIGAGIGDVCIFPNIQRSHLAPNVAKIEFYSNVSLEYALAYLMSSAGQQEIINIRKSTAQPSLSMATIRNILIPVPCKNEQIRIQKNANAFFSLIADIERDKVDLSKIIKQAKSKILDLAIRGKLVPQDPNDEPASILLERIKAEHPESKRKAKNISDNSHYAFNIPESWIWCDICDVCDVSPKNKIDDEVNVSFIPMTLITEGFSNKHRSETRKWGKVKKGFTHFRDGDVGIAKITPCFENRKSVVFKDLENQYGAGTTELHILRPISKYLSSAYILWFVKTDSFITSGISCFTGAVGQQRVGSSFVKETGFPLPPANEQKRIVKRIEEIFTSLDEIENSIKA